MDKIVDYQGLEEHICDTVKEWQMKLGYREETMQLYYQDSTLCSLLNVDSSMTKEALLKVLSGFLKYSEDRLGMCRFSYQGKRFCVEVPKQGTLYVKEHRKDSPFLRDLIDTVKKKDVTVKDIVQVFSSYSQSFVCEDRRKEELGYVLFFEDDTIDPYVYCVECDEFGASYHRFTKKDYQNLSSNH